MEILVILWIFAAALVASIAWHFGAWTAGRLWKLPYRIQSEVYPRLRRRYLCTRKKHRRFDTYEPKDGDRYTAQWWRKVTLCRDCKSLLGSVEVHREEVPENQRFVSVVDVLFGRSSS